MINGIFVSFEGIDGCGKGEQIDRFCEYLEERGLEFEKGREPGQTEIGEEIRKLLQDPRYEGLSERAELFLFEAARAIYVEEIVRPALREGKTFVSDRFFDSTTSYQGYGLNFDIGFIEQLHHFATEGIRPDLTFLIDVDPKIALPKIKGGEFGDEEDRIETRNLEYFTKVREGYLEIAKREPLRFRVIPYVDGDPGLMQEWIRRAFDVYCEGRKTLWLE